MINIPGHFYHAGYSHVYMEEHCMEKCKKRREEKKC